MIVLTLTKILQFIDTSVNRWWRWYFTRSVCLLQASPVLLDNLQPKPRASSSEAAHSLPECFHRTALPTKHNHCHLTSSAPFVLLLAADTLRHLLGKWDAGECSLVVTLTGPPVDGHMDQLLSGPASRSKNGQNNWLKKERTSEAQTLMDFPHHWSPLHWGMGRGVNNAEGQMTNTGKHKQSESLQLGQREAGSFV